LLESGGEIEVVGDAGSVVEAVPSLFALQPDVAILDERLPDGSGLDVCRRLHREAPSIASIILSSQGEDDAVVAAFGAGAAGFLLKQLRDHRLVESVHRVAAGQTLFSQFADDPRFV
jgi:DNA-binding NarL/FixJ family response regulator